MQVDRRALVGLALFLTLALALWLRPGVVRDGEQEVPERRDGSEGTRAGEARGSASSEAPQWTPLVCDLGGEMSYMAELRGPGIQAQLGVEEGRISLPFPMRHGIATGPEGAWEIQVFDGQCEARRLRGQASILGEVLSAIGRPVQGVHVSAECALGLQDGPRLVGTTTAWDGSFALDIPTDQQRDDVPCQVRLQRGVKRAAEVMDGPRVNAVEQPYLTLVAPPLTLPLSADPELACEESAAFRAVFELRDTGEFNDIEVTLAQITEALPDCGVADLTEVEDQAWRDWFNAKGPRP